MKKTFYASTMLRTIAVGFNNNGWKKDESGALVLDGSGNPIYIDAEGRERAVNSQTIGQLNGEARTHREAKEAAEAKLAKYGDLDPDKARAALDTVSKLDSKTLIDAGKVDEVKAQITALYEGQINELKTENGTLKTQLDDSEISSHFATSEFVRDKIAIPPDMFQSTFKNHFKREDGKLVPYDHTGNVIYSSKNMGEVADFDDAIVRIVEGYKHKDKILRAPDASGSGNNGQGGNRGGTGRTVRRADFDAMNAAEKANTAAAAAKGEVTIAD